VSTNAPRPGSGGQRSAGIDKRRDPRVKSLLSVWCETESLTSIGRVLNFSRGGLFVAAPFELAKGTCLTLSHRGSNGQIIATDAEVMWRRPRSAEEPSGMGVRFVSPEESTRLYNLFRDKNDR
jgi:hypothetical protein